MKNLLLLLLRLLGLAGCATAPRQAGKQVDYMLLADEGHGARNWPNNLKIYRRAEDFLAKCLGGRSSGFDLYELASSMF